MANYLFFIMLFPFLMTVFVIIFLILFLANGSAGLFFVQKRMGRFGHPFKIYKFQTLANDMHINRFTRFLRHTGLDELPQILNIIKVEMLLFGPRPKLWHEIPDEYMAEYQQYILKRHPGLLSLCMSKSVLGQSLYRTREEMKKDAIRILAYERYEQKRWSFKLMWIIFFCCFRTTVRSIVSIPGKMDLSNTGRVLE
jgi:lipopolysaccharide/colanic/teichoic acid biosynthesis glycosyltransferase